ncbi:hypothetical protein GCM10020229_71460 [Kitasatospora albolonga]
MNHRQNPAPAWHDTSRSAEDRADALIAAMTLREKNRPAGRCLGRRQRRGWRSRPAPARDGGAARPGRAAPARARPADPPFGTAPVDPALGALSLLRSQQLITAANRFGIPALAHEECLAGFAAWGATAYPVPLSWGAAFDPDLVREMAAAIGRDLRAVGVHQGLAPVLDVVRDARWGRVEETIGEDPYLVGTVATAYVQGLESAGIVATLKHFAGYSASRAGRNLAR